MRKFTIYNLQFTILITIIYLLLFAFPITVNAAEGGCPTSWVNIGSWEVGCNTTLPINEDAQMMRFTMTGGGGDDGHISFYCCGSSGAQWHTSDGNWYAVTDQSDALDRGNTKYTSNFGAKRVNSQYFNVGCNDGERMNVAVDVCIVPPPPPPTPSVSSNVSCLPSPQTGNEYTVSWGTANPIVTWVDISTSPSFNTAWNKDVTNTGSPTRAFSGFNGSPSFSPNTTYYVRLWNGRDHSDRTSFATPNNCPAPTPTPTPTPTPAPTATPFPQPTHGITTATSCGSGLTRAIGLVSTPALTTDTKFNTNGACIVDSKAAFVPYRLLTYDYLKSIYYTQAKSSASAIKEDPSTYNDSIGLGGGKDHIYNFTGNVSITSPSATTGSQTGVIFIDGNLSIGPISSSKLTGGTGLVFIVRNDVFIDPSVTQIDAVIISGGTIYTAASSGSACNTSSVSALALTINGSLVSLDSAKPIRFCRNLSDNKNPAEIINQQPKYLVILKDLMSDTFQKWSEIL